jgi:23S rRNA pseudouridine2457 synthase
MRYQYIIFYKPFQVLCQFSPEGDKQTLAHFLNVSKDIYPVGRLDYDSEGLIMLTNNKALNAQMLLPGKGHEKEYWVQVEGEVTEEALFRLSSGVIIKIDGKEHKTLPAKARKLAEPEKLPPRVPPIRYRAHIPTSWVSLTLTEGKNRQVRRMTAAVGFPTLRLIRWRIGNHNLACLNPGDYRFLNSI